MTANQNSLVQYRLDQADESIVCARLLIDHQQHRGAVNRAYYAMFYAVLALLAIRRTTVSKHAGVIAQFDRDFVKSGPFPTSLSQALHEAFDLRQRSDYREMFTVSGERTAALVLSAAGFVAAVKDHLAQVRD
jgi:uncharacterized protein